MRVGPLHRHSHCLLPHKKSERKTFIRTHNERSHAKKKDTKITATHVTTVVFLFRKVLKRNQNAQSPNWNVAKNHKLK